VWAARAADQDVWTPDENVAVERVCQLFELALSMQKRRMLPRHSIERDWGHAIERAWTVAMPLLSYREKREMIRVWPHFQEVGLSLAREQRDDRPKWLERLRGDSIERGWMRAKV
jgi:hypothetical protein